VIVREDDATKRQEHLTTFHSRLDEMEQHFATTNKPFFGGLNLSGDATVMIMMMTMTRAVNFPEI